MPRYPKLEKKWTQIATDALVGKRIVSVHYMSEDEANRSGWSKSPVVITLHDGTIIYPSMDDEGNNGGSIFTNLPGDSEILPTL